MKVNENKVEQSPTGGALVGKKNGQTIIHDKGTMSGYLVGKLHKDGGIKAINKSTGQPLEMQGGEVVITAPAVADQSKRMFEGQMLTNREILSKINADGGGVSFADGGDIDLPVRKSGKSYNYGGKMTSDDDILNDINSCGCKHSMKLGGVAKGMSTLAIAKKHNVSISDLSKQVKIGLKVEAEHTKNKREQMLIVKDHLYENPTYYTILKKARLSSGANLDQGEKEVVFKRWSSLVNMSSSELENFKKSKEGMQAGMSNIEAKKLGIKSGRQSAKWILKMKSTPETEWTPEMYRWANRQISFISRMKNVRGALYDDQGRKTRKHTALLIWGHNPEKFVSGGNVKKQNLVKDSKDGNSPARDLNNYNDVLDLQADGQIGGESGVYADGGVVEKKLDGYEIDFFTTPRAVYANIIIPTENPTFEDDLQIKGEGKSWDEAYANLKKQYTMYKTLEKPSGATVFTQGQFYENGGQVLTHNLVFEPGGAIEPIVIEKITLKKNLRKDNTYSDLLISEFDSFKYMQGALKYAFEKEGNKIGGFSFYVNEDQNTIMSFVFSEKKNTVKNFNPQTGKSADFFKQIQRLYPRTSKKFDWTNWLNSSASAPVKQKDPIDPFANSKAANSQPGTINLRQTKIKNENRDVAEKVLEKAIEQGFFGVDKNFDKSATYFYFSGDGYIESGYADSIFNQSTYKEITPEQVLGNSKLGVDSQGRLTDLNDTKVRVADLDQWTKIQKRAFELGIKWSSGVQAIDYTESPYMYIYEGKMFRGNLEKTWEDKKNLQEVTVEMILGTNKKPSSQNNFPLDSLGRLTYLNDCKVKVESEEQSEKIQQRAFELGFKWASGDQVVLYKYAKFLYFNDNEIRYSDDWDMYENLSNTEVTPELILGKSTSTVKTVTKNTKTLTWSNTAEIIPYLEKTASSVVKEFNTESYTEALNILYETKASYEAALPFMPESAFAYERIDVMRKIAKIQKQIKNIEDLKKGGSFYILLQIIEKLKQGENWRQTMNNSEVLTNNLPKEEIEQIIRTQRFKNWFGDWEEALATNQYDNVSKATISGIPAVYYHGAARAKYSYRQVSNGVLYLAENISYAEWFAKNAFATSEEGNYLTECFVNIKNPIDLSVFHVKQIDLADLVRYIDAVYPLANIYDFIPAPIALNIKSFEQTKFTMWAWQLIRTNVKFVNHIKENTPYDGFLYYENNPSDFIQNPAIGNPEENVTKAVAIFKSNQVKVVDAALFDSELDDWRFKKGGEI